MRVMHVYVGITLLYIALPALGFKFEWRLGTKDECNARHCDTNTSTLSQLCSADPGVHIPFGARDPQHDLFSNTSCTFAEVLDNAYYNSSTFIDNIGDNAVVSFVGDSIMRNLFHSFLTFLGPEYTAWSTAIHEKAKGWKGQYREKLDHTFLCSPPLGPRNITLAFFWRNYLGLSVSRVPWVLPSMPGKFGRCVWWENGDAMHHCDGASEDGKVERWQCEDSLDQIQLAGKPRRAFILISGAGIHTAVEEIHHRNASDPADYLAHSAARFEQAWQSLEATKTHWRHVSQDGGRNIFIMPPLLLNGLPRTTNAQHESVRAMNHMLDHHFKSRLRGRCNLTCEDGLEIIEHDAVTTGPHAPGTVGDGIHYGYLTDMALMQIIVERIVKYNKSNWRAHAGSWNLQQHNQSSHMDNSC